VKMWDTMLRAHLCEHTNDDAEEPAQFRHKYILLRSLPRIPSENHMAGINPLIQVSTCKCNATTRLDRGST
jgi:hypothetical protein